MQTKYRILIWGRLRLSPNLDLIKFNDCKTLVLLAKQFRPSCLSQIMRSFEIFILGFYAEFELI